MTQRTEFILTVCMTVLVLGLMDVAYFWQHMDTLVMNKVQYKQVGMMEFTDPNDGGAVYTPVYRRYK